MIVHKQITTKKRTKLNKSKQNKIYKQKDTYKQQNP
jgi:hypothetical protein